MKKKILLNSFILGITSLPIVSLSASCDDLVLNDNQKANSDLEVFADQISKIDSSNKTELFFQSLEIDEAHPLSGTNNFEEVFGIKIVVPKDIKAEITKKLFSKILNVRVKNKNTAKDLELEIKNFAPDTEYETKLREVINKVKLINATSYDENVFKMRWLKEGNATYNAVKTKFNDYKEDAPIGDELKTLAKSELGLTIEPSLINALETIKGRQRFIIEKDYNSLDVKVTLVFAPSDVDFLFNIQNKVPGGANDYYRIRVTPKISSFAVPATKLVDKLGILRKMLEYSQEYISSGLSNDDYKTLVLSKKSIDDVETDEFGKLVITDTIKDYLITNKLQMAISKAKDTNLTKFDISTDAGDKDSISFNVFGQFIATREYFVNYKVPGSKNAISRNYSGIYLNNDDRVVYLFGNGAAAVAINMKTGNSPANVVQLRNFTPEVLRLKMHIYGFQQENKKSKIFVSGYFELTPPTPFTDVVFGDRFYIGENKYEWYPEKNDKLRYVSYFFLPIPNDKRNFHAIMKTENADPAKPNSNAGEWYVTKFDSYGNPSLPKHHQSYYDSTKVFENVLADVGDAMLRTNNPSDGYIFRLTDDKKTKVRFFIDYEDGKNLKIINNSSHWNSVDTEFKWPSVKLVKAGDGGFWLAGKNGEIVYMDKYGNVDKTNKPFNVGKELTSIVEDSKGDGAFVVGKNGYIAHVTKNASGLLTLDWERNIFRKQTILEIKKDDEGALYLVGNVPGSGGVLIEKLTPDGQKDAWERI